MATAKKKKSAKKSKAETDHSGAFDAEAAHKIWLAGVGAYGRAFDTAREQFDKVNEDTGAFFDELVARGEKIEKKAARQLKLKKRLGKVAKRAESFSDKAEAAAEHQLEFIEERMANLRDTLEMPMGVLTIGRKVRALSGQIDELASDVAEIREALKLPAKRTTKKTTKKKVVKKTAKRTAKKTPKRAIKKPAKRTAKKAPKRTTKTTVKRTAKRAPKRTVKKTVKRARA